MKHFIFKMLPRVGYSKDIYGTKNDYRGVGEFS